MSKLFTIINKDKPDSLAVRLETRTAHLDYLKSLGDDLVLAGPFLGSDDKPLGSLVIIRAENLAAAQAFADGDPYVAAGLFASREVSAWAWALNAPEGL